jgi:hypothetical protein
MAKGLKIDNKASTIPPVPKDTSQAFDRAANEATSRLTDYKNRSWELGTKFKSIIEDRMLSDNRSVLTKDFEQEIINKLSALATEINSDTTQPESMGSTALCVLLMKMLLLQRDRINVQAYKIEQLEKKATNTESK